MVSCASAGVRGWAVEVVFSEEEEGSWRILQGGRPSVGVVILVLRKSLGGMSGKEEAVPARIQGLEEDMMGDVSGYCLARGEYVL